MLQGLLAAADIPIGARVRFYREGRKLSQIELGRQVNLSEDYLSQIERGVRTPPVATLQRIARALGTSLSALVGHPAIDGVVGHPAISDIYRALLQVPPLPEAEDFTLSDLRERVQDAWQLWQSGGSNFTVTGQLLPGLILDLERGRSVFRHSEEERREAARVVTDGYFLVRQFAHQVGRPDIALAVADRARTAAQDADDPLRLGAAAWHFAYIAYRDCEFDAAEEISFRAIQELKPLIGDSRLDLLAMCGELYLQIALVAVRQADVWKAREFIRDMAVPAARRTGEGNVMWTAFGPTNCAIHAVAIEMESNHAQEGILLADQVDLSQTAVVERQARHYIELAKCYDLRQDDMGVLTHLRLSWNVGPQYVQYHPLARDMVHRLLHRARPSYAPEVRTLADRMGLK